MLEEAIEKSKILTSGSDEYGLSAKMSFAKSMKNKPMYAAAAKDISKSYLKGDVEKINSIILTIHKIFGDDKEMLKTAKDLSKKYFKKSKSVNSALAYSKTLMLLDDYAAAEKVLNKGLKNAEKSGEKSKSLEMMLKVLEKKRA